MCPILSIRLFNWCGNPCHAAGQRPPFILILSKLSEIIGLKTVAFLLQSTIQLFGFGMIVLFQPELRRALEKLGSSGFQDILLIKDDEERLKTIASIETIVNSCARCAEDYIGALIVIERDTKIGDIVNTGTRMDAALSEELLVNIFTPKTPLHDGAVIIRNSIITAAACYLPLLRMPASRGSWYRHRAALALPSFRCHSHCCFGRIGQDILCPQWRPRGI